MTTFLELQDEALDLSGLGAPTERGRVKRFLNEEYLRIVAKTGAPIKTAPAATLTQGLGTYDLTAAPFSLTDFVRVEELIYSWGNSAPFQTMPLQLVTPQQIYELRRNTVTGIVHAYAIQGVSTLMIYPAPMTGDTLALTYEYRPAAMVADSDTPALISVEQQSAIVYAAAYRAALLSRAPVNVVQFLQAEKQARQDAAVASQNRLGGNAISVRRGQRPFVPHDNSADYRGFNGY